MKKLCVCCGKECDASAKTCPYCGEASWTSLKKPDSEVKFEPKNLPKKMEVVETKGKNK